MSIAKTFEPASIEANWREKWEQLGCFDSKIAAAQDSYCIQLPPPNVTGTLHMGHAFNQTIIDGLIRYHRMRGLNTRWIPGTDHAGIATQIVVERQLEKQGQNRHQLGRENFVQRVWQWKEESGSTITRQMRRLGASADWKNEYFTLDEKRLSCVVEAFVRLYQDGLIYRGKRLVNWDPSLKTAVSDLEVASTEEQGSIWRIKYPLADGSGELIVATTRPETMLGDVAVAVHPDDERYQAYIGKKIKLPLSDCGLGDREILIIADTYVDPSFGTGCVKITPAHDFNDYQVWQRHQNQFVHLPGQGLIAIFDADARILAVSSVESNSELLTDAEDLVLAKATLALIPEAYQGLSREQAREKILADLKAQNYLHSSEAHQRMVPRNERTQVIVEPMLTRQWFVAMNKAAPASHADAGKTLAQLGLEPLLDESIRFVPDNWSSTYRQWLENLQDWCISRQLWWGHQIPAWYDEAGNIYVACNEFDAQQQAGNKVLRRDHDVLDTWFSSALVPFSTLGWPEETQELKTFLPSSVLVTGFDIIFFWVARMVMLTRYFTQKIPFHVVYVHGLVRDANGQKMSKSKGNTLDPIDLIDGISLPDLIKKRTQGLMNPKQAEAIAKATEAEFTGGIAAYGTDALRLTMTSYASLGRNINFDLKRCEGYRNFCNKLWNATRFVHMQLSSTAQNDETHFKLDANISDLPERWIRSELQKTIALVHKGFEQFRFDLITQALYQFIWEEFCDWYLELAKVQLKFGNAQQQQLTRETLLFVLDSILKLAHPIIPFITEALWQSLLPLLGHLDETTISISQQAYPLSDENALDQEAEQLMSQCKAVINACRNLRSEMQLSPAKQVPLIWENAQAFKPMAPYLQAMAKISSIDWLEQLPQSPAPVAVVEKSRLMLQVEVDVAAEKMRLEKELSKIQIEIDKCQAKLNNPSFTERAPEAVVAQEKARLQSFGETLKQLEQQYHYYS